MTYSDILIPDALQSELRAYQGSIYRCVEAQHLVSTMKLVDTTAEQAMLEDALEGSKPPIPVGARHLGFLLSTPFRYRSRHDSRFRKAVSDYGVFYGAENSETAVREMVFYRLLFFAESPGTQFPREPTQYSVFTVDVAAARALDLTEEPLKQHYEYWTRLADYGPCQELADVGRGIDLQMVAYQSVRHNKGKKNVAIFDPAVFVGQPAQCETWNVFIGPAGAQAIREAPRFSFDCSPSEYIADPRLAQLVKKYGQTLPSQGEG